MWRSRLQLIANSTISAWNVAVNKSQAVKLRQAQDATIVTCLRDAVNPGGYALATSARVKIAETAMHTLRALATCGYHTGSQVCVGPRGQGKSHLLKQVVQVAETVYPNVIPLYVSHEDHRTTHVAEDILRHFQEREMVSGDDVATALKENKGLDLVFGLLAYHRKKLFVVIDELDDMYKLQAGSGPAADAALETLRFLQRVFHTPELYADTASFLLTGTTNLLQMCMSREDVDSVGVTHPLVHAAPRLGAAKYQHVGQLGTADVVAWTVLRDVAGGLEPSPTDWRVLAYTCGSNVGHMLAAAASVRALPLVATIPKQSPYIWARPPIVRPEDRAMLRAIATSAFTANKDVAFLGLSKGLVGGSIWSHASVDWKVVLQETGQLSPCTTKEVVLNRLVDAGWVSVQESPLVSVPTRVELPALVDMHWHLRDFLDKDDTSGGEGGGGGGGGGCVGSMAQALASLATVV
jgi:hypothetical protein